jgi:IS5 family transposase
MDFMLEEEMIDLITFCIQNPDSTQVAQKRQRMAEIGRELYADGGLDALENMFFALENRIKEETGKSPSPFRATWNGNTPEWEY